PDRRGARLGPESGARQLPPLPGSRLSKSISPRRHAAAHPIQERKEPLRRLISLSIVCGVLSLRSDGLKSVLRLFITLAFPEKPYTVEPQKRPIRGTP